MKMTWTFDPIGVLSLVIGSGIITGGTGAFTLGRFLIVFLGLGIAQVQATYKGGSKWLRGD